VYLVGMMGSGKSALGSSLADLLGSSYTFVDSDAAISTTLAPSSISQFFETFGEDAFRDVETAALEDLHARRPSVVSTGGGIVLKSDNWSLMRHSGVSLFIDVDKDVILNRLQSSDGAVSSRPVLADTADSEPLDAKLTRIMASRRSQYELADITVRVDDAEETVERTTNRILDAISRFVDTNPDKFAAPKTDFEALNQLESI
jgi:shikimate kinase